MLVFRQQAASATARVVLRGVPDGKVFDLYEAPTGARVASVTSQQLQNGLRVTLPRRDTARVLLVRPRS